MFETCTYSAVLFQYIINELKAAKKAAILVSRIFPVVTEGTHGNKGNFFLFKLRSNPQRALDMEN